MVVNLFSIIMDLYFYYCSYYYYYLNFFSNMLGPTTLLKLKSIAPEKWLFYINPAAYKMLWIFEGTECPFTMTQSNVSFMV